MTTAQNPTLSLSHQHSLYERDFYQWLILTVKLLQEKSFEQIDLDNLIRELEATSRRTQITLRSNLRVLLINLLEYKYQPSVRSESYESTMIKHRRRILDIFSQSPSLKPYLTEVFDECYSYARKCTSAQANLPLELLPMTCPFTQEDILNTNYLPE